MRPETKEELIFTLFEELSTSKEQALSNFKKDCIANCFSIALSIHGIIKLLEFISFVKITKNKIKLNGNVFNPSRFEKPNIYFETYHFYKKLTESLKKYEAINYIFNEENLKFSLDSNEFYVKDSLIPYKFFPIRNLLLSTDFFDRDELVKNHLFIKKEFTNEIREDIVSNFAYPQKGKHKKISLEELREVQKKKEKYGEAYDET